MNLEGTRDEIIAEIKASKRYQFVEAGIGRPCLVISEGEPNSRSWFGKVEWAVSGETWPMFNGKPMEPFLQIDCRNLPFLPEHCQDLVLITLFAYPGPFEWTRRNGDGWCLRTYDKSAELIALQKPSFESTLKAVPLRFEEQRDYPVGALGEPEIAEDDELADALEEQIDEREWVEDETGEYIGYRELYPNQQGLKMGGWPTWMHAGNDWPGETSLPQFVMQIPNLADWGWSHREMSFIYLARGTREEKPWVLDLQSYITIAPGLLPVNLYHRSLVGADPRVPLSEWEEESYDEPEILGQHQCLLSKPCCSGNVRFDVTIHSDGHSQSYYETNEGEGQQQSFFEGGDSHFFATSPQSCSDCNQYWVLDFEPEGSTITVQVKNAFATLSTKLDSVEELLQQSKPSNALVEWQNLANLAKDIPRETPEFIRKASLGVRCALATSDIGLALEAARLLPLTQKEEQTTKILGTLSKTSSPLLVQQLSTLNFSLDDFWASGPSRGSKPGGKAQEFVWRACLGEGEARIDVTLSGEVENNQLTLHQFETLPLGMNHKLTAIEFEDDPKQKATHFFLAARTCLACGLTEYALILLQQAKRYFPESEMVAAELKKLSEAGVEKMPWTREFEVKCEAL